MNRKFITLPELKKELFVTSYAQIRPYREGGYRIQHQTIKNKEIFHNYGHGGSGVSWSYGSAVRIVNIFEKNKNDTQTNCAVVGSGIVGLLTALQLTNRNFKVKVYSKKIPRYSQKNNKNLITSQIAPGFWFPYDYLDIKQLNTDQLASITMSFLRKSIEQKKYSGLKYCKTYDQIYLTQIIQKFKNVLIEKNQKSLINFGNGKYHDFNEFSTVRIDMQVWLKQLITQLKSKGVQFINKAFNNVNQVIELQERSIFNCTGYGAKYLFNDNQMKALRGHIIEFKNPNPAVFNYIFGTKVNGQIIRIYGHDTRILLGLTKEESQLCQVDLTIVNRMIENYNKLFKEWTHPTAML